MENLPFLVLEKIFKLMPNLREVIKCSLVCRNWRAAYEAMIKPETLCLYRQELIPLNHRLFHTREKLEEFSFLKSLDHFQFLDSPFSRSHFAHVKRLVLYLSYPESNLPRFRLRNQLNHFKDLEYVEIACNITVLEGCQIDLPKLKTFSCAFDVKFENDIGQIVLNTPSLEALRIMDYGRQISEKFVKKFLLNLFRRKTSQPAKITNFNILYPDQLKLLELQLHEIDFKFDRQFPNLEILIFRKAQEIVKDQIKEDPKKRLFDEEFFKCLPGLKFLFLGYGLYWANLPALEAEKRKFNLNDLKILTYFNYFEFNYQNWHPYVEHKKQLSYWPARFDLVFDKLIDCQIPLRYFKENYLRLDSLSVRHVTDQPLLVDFLRNVELGFLKLEYDCNLGQSFLEAIARSVSIGNLILGDCVLHRLNDLSVLSCLNTFRFILYFRQFQREVALAVLRNPACPFAYFYCYDGFHEDDVDGEDGREIRKEYNIDYHRSHIIYRATNVFFCHACLWISSKDPNSSEDPIEVTIQHIEKPRALPGT